MKPGKSASFSSSIARISLVLPVTLNRNLKFFCAEWGRRKNVVIAEAISEFLIKRGYQPDKWPKPVWPKD